MDFCCISRHILSTSHGHNKINTIKVISHLCAKFDISDTGLTDFIGKSIPGTGTGCGCTIMAFFPFHLHSSPAVPVINGPAFRSCTKALFNNMPRNFYVIVLDPCTGLFHHFMDFFMLALKSYSFNNIKSSLFYFPDLIISENFHANGSGLNV